MTACLPEIKINLKGAGSDRVFIIVIIMSCTVFTNYIPGEMCISPLSISADCQGTQMNFFGNFLHEQ